MSDHILCDGCEYYDNTNDKCCRDICKHVEEQNAEKTVRKRIINIPRKKKEP